jgi:hypothetical protein
LGPSGSGAARLAAIPAGESPASKRSPVHAVVIPSGGAGDQSAGSLEVKALWGPGDLVRSVAGGRATWQAVAKVNQEAPKYGPRAKRIAGNYGSAEPLRSRRRPMPASKNWTITMHGLPGVIEGGMSGWNEQRKPGTTRGSPRCSRTAKASRISRHAAKSRCAREWGGWGRLSDDGSGQNNPNLSEDPWGGGLPTLHGGAPADNRPGSERDNRGYDAVHEGRKQTSTLPAYAGSRLKLGGVLGRPRLKRQPSSRTGENPPYGMIGGIEETSASFEARSAPRSYPTAGGEKQFSFLPR